MLTCLVACGTRTLGDTQTRGAAVLARVPWMQVAYLGRDSRKQVKKWGAGGELMWATG